MKERALPSTELPGERTTGLPERIGPYRILEPLGQGGFGAVYLAEQEEPVRRRVALKLIKLGMDTEQVIARFEAERHSRGSRTAPGRASDVSISATQRTLPFPRAVALHRLRWRGTYQRIPHRALTTN